MNTINKSEQAIATEEKSNKSFKDCLLTTTDQENNPIEHRPEFLISPFQKELSIRVKKMPNIAALADPHITASQSSLEKVDGLASYKRRLLANITPVRNRIRLIDAIARFSFRRAIEEAEKNISDGGLFISLGDTIISTEASNTFSAFSTLEKTLKNLQNKLQLNNPNEQNPLTVLNLVGNHYDFTNVEKKDYDQMAKIYSTLDNQTFEELVSALKKGYSWDNIVQAWNTYRNILENPHLAIHPLQKWYLEKLTFGSQVGRYLTDESGKTTSQAVFLDNLVERGGTKEDLLIALNELEITKNSPVYSEIISCQQLEEQKQKELIKIMLDDCLQGVKTVVYTHWPELIQDKLVLYTQEQFTWDEEKSRKFIENNIQIWGGHRHLAEQDLAKERKGVTWVKAVTREFISFLVQKPFDPKKLMFLPFTFKKPFDKSDVDFPELIIGPADNPQKIAVKEIMTEFNQLLESIKQS
jgi:hypothetical protein